MSKPRLPAALHKALAQLQAGADPAEVAASIIKVRQEAAVLRAQLPAGDSRQEQLDALKLALEGRTFDDSGLSLEDVLRDLQEHEQHPQG